MLRSLRADLYFQMKLRRMVNPSLRRGGLPEFFRRNYEDKLTNTLDPMSRMSSLRCMIQIVAQYGCITHQSGVTTGCLNADLGHNILIGQSHRIARNGSNTVCYLRKSLYGLKQGAKPWNDTIHGYLVSWVYHIIL